MIKRLTPAIWTAVILASGFAVMLVINLPGQLSYDSTSQLFDGRSGHYNSWHPAVMAWLLGLFDTLLPGPSLFVVFTAMMLAAAFALSLRRDSGWGATAIALAFVLMPQLLLFQGAVWKDVLFTNAFILSFALLARATSQRGDTRLILLVLFFPCLALAGLARQNGLLLLPVGALTFGFAMAPKGAGKAGANIWPRLLRAGAALLLLLALVGGTAAMLARRGDGGEGLNSQIQLAQIYDLTGAVRQGYRMTLLSRSDPALADAIMGAGAHAYSLQMQDTLEPVLPQTIAKGAVMAQWQALLLQQPGLYLRVRLPVFWQVLATPDITLCHPAYVGIDGDRQQLKTLGLTARRRPQDLRLATYVRGFMGTPVLSHLAFGILAVALLGFYLSRRRPGDIAMTGMLAGAIGFSASFFFISVACDYRYLLPLDMAAILALFHVFAVRSPPQIFLSNKI